MKKFLKYASITVGLILLVAVMLLAFGSASAGLTQIALRNESMPQMRSMIADDLYILHCDQDATVDSAILTAENKSMMSHAYRYTLMNKGNAVGNMELTYAMNLDMAKSYNVTCLP